MKRLDITDAKRSGRPLCLSKAVVKKLVNYVTRKQFNTARRVRAHLNLTCSEKTLRRALRLKGLVIRVPRQDAAFKLQHQQKRLSFATGYSSFDWNKVLWSDEKCFWLNEKEQCWVIRPIGEEWNPKYMCPKMRKSSKINVFACFSDNGLGNIVTFKENLTGAGLRDLLSDNLLESATRLYGEGVPFWFQHDNDPKFKSHIVTTWLHNNGVQCLEWPPCSPDLNPIENLWVDVNNRIKLHHPKTVDQLEDLIHSEWFKTEMVLLKSLVKSLPDRCRAVIASMVHTTAY
jgi:hypothetical protein